MADDPTPEDLEQLARSIAMSGVLGDRDRGDVIDALRVSRRPLVVVILPRWTST